MSYVTSKFLVTALITLLQNQHQAYTERCLISSRQHVCSLHLWQENYVKSKLKPWIEAWLCKLESILTAWMHGRRQPGIRTASVYVSTTQRSRLNHPTPAGDYQESITPGVDLSSKRKVHPGTGHEGPQVKKRYSSTLSLTSALDEGGWSTPRPGRFTPGKDPVSIVQEAGWALGPVWTGADLSSMGCKYSPHAPFDTL
jgi:hypothetical protein